MADDSSGQNARNIVYRLLKYRLHSEEEIRSRLKAKKFSSEVISATIDHFKETDFIDDRHFARGWIASRLNKPLGSQRIQFELIQKGVNRAIIQEELNEAMENYCEEEVVFNLARQRLDKYRHLEKEKAHTRLTGYLSRRGFNRQVIFNALKKLA